MNNIINLINLIATIQGFFLGAVLLFIRRKNYSNILLAFLFFSISFSMLRWYSYEIQLHNLYYYLMYLNLPNFYIHGPLIYLYCRNIISNEKSINKKDICHFIPFVVYLSYLLIRFNLLGNARSMDDITLIDQHSVITNLHLITLGSISIAIYLAASIFISIKYMKSVKEYYSEISHTLIIWLRTILGTGTFLTILLITIQIILIAARQSSVLSVVNTIFFINFMLLTFSVNYFTIRYPDLFKIPTVKEKSSYTKHLLDEATEKEYTQKLLDCMENRKLYLDDSLTLQYLSEDLSISCHHLSMILNQKLKTNFYMFVNGYRVEEVKRLLHDPQYSEHTVIAIALISGFNSKSTFNAIFKKITGITPTEFRNSLKN